MGRDLRFLPLYEKPENLRDVYDSEHWVDDRGKIWSYGISRHNDYIDNNEYLSCEEIVEKIDNLWKLFKGIVGTQDLGPSTGKNEEERDDESYWKRNSILEAISTYAFILHEIGPGGVFILYQQMTIFADEIRDITDKDSRGIRLRMRRFRTAGSRNLVLPRDRRTVTFDEDAIKASKAHSVRSRSEPIVRKSTIPEAGKGAFATRTYNKYEYLGTYKGRLITPSEFMKMKDAAYTWELVDEDDDPIAYIDARDPRISNWTRYANCPCKKSQENIIPIQFGFEMRYYAKREIKRGEELFVWYGPEYGKQLIGRDEL